jgi:phosphatidate cytidylyltransferase
LGKHKMIRRISPGKTWEGAVGGAVASILAAVGFQQFVLAGMTGGAYSLWMAVVFGLVVGIIGQSGDLAESLLKRGSGVKDAGNFVPGFGGVLDLVDSLLAAAPAAFLLYFLLLGTVA